MDIMHLLSCAYEIDKSSWEPSAKKCPSGLGFSLSTDLSCQQVRNYVPSVCGLRISFNIQNLFSISAYVGKF